MTESYTTAAEVRTQIELAGTTGSVSDAALQILIDAASQAIRMYYNRDDYHPILAEPVAAARRYAGNGTPFCFIDECVAISTVEVKDSPTDTAYVTWASTDYIPFSGDPEHPDYNRIPYTALMVDPTGSYDIFTSGSYTVTRGFRPVTGIGRGVPTIQVTARWGYASITPPAVQQACIILVSRMIKQGQAAWADTTAMPELGQMMYKQINSEIKFILDAMRLHRPAV